MSITLETLEGRLLAQRKVLARLVAALDGPAGDELRDYVRDRSHMIADEEDPGAVPGEGLSIEGALADEMHHISEAAEAHRKAS
ncbi:hypothetical protein [Limimaricola hongkongensis]|uniref:Uncharacterized protein n=1 Tax=Limimaricola hongkongensis DSM 17492 TaxID=1122180 RepID=A0A017H987_9RHOB|nr:hypothetical protein [Limimaricola hongkongensis]EYD70708.1 hypothetical protein Lokhon_02349 [Limimaricola hongkongensis DSM 17492]